MSSWLLRAHVELVAMELLVAHGELVVAHVKIVADVEIVAIV